MCWRIWNHHIQEDEEKKWEVWETRKALEREREKRERKGVWKFELKLLCYEVCEEKQGSS